MDNLNVHMVTAWMPVSREMVESALPPWDEMERQMADNARAFAALPPEEQARIRAEREAAYEAQRCPTCGTHPDD